MKFRVPVTSRLGGCTANAALVSVPDDPWWEVRVLHAKLYPPPHRWV
ncbi:hypothetical protein [Kitasatospora paracochleata]|uniref:Uncharacterized protein n=1 Tax=Kitasatospora paracochleata TaxID=58354 RepID=A0ABT1J0B7_9ACTN|nr:hypothetical protein [Kitasatospora paracochleata]MCP2310860.1 hypothetical protein [Kitasatospora paracochleata]MCP2314295.1 hypothetical protein [Kitasatospora paracochleata]